MYKKIESLNRIISMGLNIYEFFIPNTYYGFNELVTGMKLCTIRTDHKIKTEDLPFYIFNDQQDTVEKINMIWQEAENNGYKLIVSNGIKYDNIQEYNMVAKISKNGNFIFEASELKIPLRHMYRHPLLSCSGNLKNNIHSWDIYNQKYGIDKLSIKHDLEELYTYKIFDKWLEVTKYPIKLGTQNKNIIFWQII